MIIMINDIEKLKIRSSKYIKEFMQGCTIEEKIDTHYITIDIISRNAIVFKKANEISAKDYKSHNNMSDTQHIYIVRVSYPLLQPCA